MNREVYNGAIDTQHENTLVSPGTQENYGAITFLPLTICVLCVYAEPRSKPPRSKQPPSTKSSRSESSWCRTGRRRWWSLTTMTTGMASKTMSLHARDTEGVWENDKLCLLFKPRELETLGWPKSAPSKVDVLSAYIAVAGTAAVISFIVLVTPTFYRVVVVVLHFLRVLAASLEIGSMNFAPRVAQCNLAWKFWGVLQTLLHTSKELPYVQPCHSTLWPNSPKSPQIRKIQLLNIKKWLVWFQSIYTRTSKFQIIWNLNKVGH